VEAEVVVESYQVAGRPMQPVFLTRTAPLEGDLDPFGRAVTGATVVVEQVDAAGAVVATTPFAERDTLAGTYDPAPATGTPPLVAPLTTYRLRVDVPATGETLTAETLVPGAVDLVEAINTDAVYQGPVQPSLTIDLAEYPTRQNVFLFTTTSLLDFDTLSRQELEAELVPFVADILDDDEDISELRVGSSPLLNASNYDTNPDGTVTIDLPWLAVTFYGPNRVAVSAVDDALFDFLRSQAVQQGDRPGEIPDVIDRVEGGTGVFGSYATLEVEVMVRRE
jgi:hypothetical protein